MHARAFNLLHARLLCSQPRTLKPHCLLTAGLTQTFILRVPQKPSAILGAGTTSGDLLTTHHKVRGPYNAPVPHHASRFSVSPKSLKQATSKANCPSNSQMRTGRQSPKGHVFVTAHPIEDTSLDQLSGGQRPTIKFFLFLNVSSKVVFMAFVPKSHPPLFCGRLS